VKNVHEYKNTLGTNHAVKKLIGFPLGLIF